MMQGRDFSIGLLCRAALLAVLALASQAAAGGAPIDFTPHGTQPGLQFEHEASNNCLNCHGGFNATERRYMPWNTWAGTMKANAARDPLFWAALDVANRDAPGVGDFCLRCHTPSAWYGGRVAKAATGAPIDGADGCKMQGDADDQDELGNDFDGIGCHFCHRLRETGPNGEVARKHNGNLWVDDQNCDNDGDGQPDSFGPCRIGPYKYPEPGIDAAPHPAAFSTWVKRSEMCAACHDISTPVTSVGPLKTLILPDGTDSQLPFPIERTYSEWRASAFADRIFADGMALDEPRGDTARWGETCQACHMPQTPEPQARSCQQNMAGSRAGNLGIHEFAGANAWMPGVISGLYGANLGSGRQQAFAQAAAAATAMLQRSASLDLSLSPLAAAPGSLRASVRLTNLAGHKIPSGYSEGRRMWLELEARDAAGNVFWRSNPYDAATGNLTIDRDDAVYEVKQGTWNASATPPACETNDAQGRPAFHFVLNNCIAKDNRVPPRGFAGGNDLELRPIPVGRYPPAAPGASALANWDDRTWDIAVPAGTSLPVTVQVRLRHQVATREYVEFLRNQAVERAVPSENMMCADDRAPLATGPRTQTRGQFAYDQWVASGRSPPVTMATTQSASGPGQ
ncbi:MAG: hypothetical protein LW860_07210 [Xanthomonadaceae bacterium]|jgi:hypothetical protein|nr:hypothetical protein [Xanthomonadaceae bacterium]